MIILPFFLLLILSFFLVNILMPILSVPATLISFCLPNGARRIAVQFIIGITSCLINIITCKWFYSKVFSSLNFGTIELLVVLLPVCFYAIIDLRLSFIAYFKLQGHKNLKLMNTYAEEKIITPFTVACTTFGSVMGVVIWLIFLR